MALREIRRTLKRAVDLQSLRTISSDELLSMHQDDAQAIRVQATRAVLNSEIRFVCDLCGHAVYAPNDKNGKPLWAHHKGAPEDCPWWTGVPIDVDTASASQFQGAQESALHITIKNIVAELLERDARTERGSVVIDRYLSTENGRRRPDVRANYDGVPTVIEVQLATTQIPIIIGREDFYQHEDFRLVWLTWNFEFPKPDQRLLTSFNDIFHEHAKCLFSMDSETIARSRSEGVVFIKAFWIGQGGWTSRILSLSELGWLPSGRASLPSSIWADEFLSCWLSATDMRGTGWDDRLRMLDVLARRLELGDRCGRNLEDEGMSDLINCLLSIREGRPIGSRQNNLTSLLNTFLQVERRHRFAGIIRRVAVTNGRENSLVVPSVRRKLEVAQTARQDGQRSLAGRIALTLFPDLLQHPAATNPRVASTRLLETE